MKERISELPAAATALDGTEELPIVQVGVTSKTTAQAIANLFSPSTKSYKAYLQNDGDLTNPVLWVVKNELPGIVTIFSAGEGTLLIECSGDNAFPFHKTIVRVSNGKVAYYSTTVAGSTVINQVRHKLSGPNVIELDFTQADMLGNLIPSFDYLQSTEPVLLEIEVEPADPVSDDYYYGGVGIGIEHIGSV